MLGRLILSREDATALAATGHVAASDKARPELCEVLIAWHTDGDKTTVKATATDSYCAAIRQVTGQVVEGTPPKGDVSVNARDLIAAVKGTETHQRIVCFDLDDDYLTVGGRLLPINSHRDFPPIQAKLESVVNADAAWQGKRYGALPAMSPVVFAKVAKAWAQPALPLRMMCLPDEKGEAWTHPIMWAPCSTLHNFRAWQMPVRI